MIKISIVKIIKKELKSQITEIAPFLYANIEKKIESPKFISKADFSIKMYLKPNSIFQ